MFSWHELLLVAGIVGVGILHTMVPDHWAPIALLARQRGWSTMETARVALQAGFGHVGTTLFLGLAVWIVGVAAAQTFGHVIDSLASVALVAFGLWIAGGAWAEARTEEKGSDRGDTHDHPRDHDSGDAAGHAHGLDGDRLYSPTRGVSVAERHVHVHRHGAGPAHTHWHDHVATTAHAITADTALSPPMHFHKHRTTGRMTLLLVLGSSPMMEGIPAFFAASRYGAGLILTMSIAFALSTIATYVLLSVFSASSLQRLNLGPIERYGEVLSGTFIAVIGLAFGLWSLA